LCKILHNFFFLSITSVVKTRSQHWSKLWKKIGAKSPKNRRNFDSRFNKQLIVWRLCSLWQAQISP
jgi:hypothetical protein